MTEKSILYASGLCKSFGTGHTRVDAVRDISLQIMPGELVLVMGPSGSGKTTLLSMLGGLLSPTSGTIKIAGTDITTMPESGLSQVRASKIGFIFQSFNLLEALTVRQNILFPSQLIAGQKQQSARLAEELINKLGLEQRHNALPETLSGGEKQRVAIARALINNPALILADEPTGNLDSQSGQDVMMLLRETARNEGRAVLMVTHDPRVEEIADRVLWLEDGAFKARQSRHDWTHCPVCKMRVDKLVTNYSISHESHLLYFCSEQCLEQFQADPLAYF